MFLISSCQQAVGQRRFISDGSGGGGGVTRPTTTSTTSTTCTGDIKYNYFGYYCSQFSISTGKCIDSYDYKSVILTDPIQYFAYKDPDPNRWPALKYCKGKKAFIAKASAYGACSKENMVVNCNIEDNILPGPSQKTSPQLYDTILCAVSNPSPGDYYACVDKNSDGDFSDSGETSNPVKII